MCAFFLCVCLCVIYAFCPRSLGYIRMWLRCSLWTTRDKWLSFPANVAKVLVSHIRFSPKYAGPCWQFESLQKPKGTQTKINGNCVHVCACVCVRASREQKISANRFLHTNAIHTFTAYYIYVCVQTHKYAVGCRMRRAQNAKRSCARRFFCALARSQSPSPDTIYRAIYCNRMQFDLPESESERDKNNITSNRSKRVNTPLECVYDKHTNKKTKPNYFTNKTPLISLRYIPLLIV